MFHSANSFSANPFFILITSRADDGSNEAPTHTHALQEIYLMSKTTTKAKKHSKDDPAKIRKRFLHEFESAFWANPGFQNGQDVHHHHHHHHETRKKSASATPDSAEASGGDTTDANGNANSSAVREHTSCNTCNIMFESHYDLRDHFQDDIHRLNLKRKLRNKPPIDEDTFERDFDNLSDGSLSGSGEEDSDTDDDQHEANNSKAANARGKANVRVQFRDPTLEGDGEGYIVVYKAALPDTVSLGSFSDRGSWCVIMAGGGHFSAAIWDEHGKKIQNKSFHRYTTRRKQGGAQSIADGGKTIKSAGSTLRRYGEQALQAEVRDLLMSWADDLQKVQCVYLRVNKRDRMKLLFGWEDSPLLDHRDNDMCRNIPFSTRRATLKEVSRVYEQLSTVVLSPVSLIAAPVEIEKSVQGTPSKSKAANATVGNVSSKTKSKAPVEKGTAHLKKREPKEQKANEEEEKEEVVLDETFVKLIASINEDKLEEVKVLLEDNAELISVEFEVGYFKTVENMKKVKQGCGVIAVAAACAAFNVLEWLLLNEAPIMVGTSPYLVTKAKRVRTFLRRFWAQHPTLHDYASAEIPGPLSEAEVAAAAEKEREKKKKEREKKKEKEFLKKEAAKPPEVRAREMRAAAAEARFLGNRCAVCKKSLNGITPFERLAYKYCSMDCCQKHRQVLKG